MNGDMSRITFVMLSVHELAALMSSSQSETHLLLYAHEELARPLHSLCSSIIYALVNLYIYIYIMRTQAVCAKRLNVGR